MWEKSTVRPFAAAARRPFKRGRKQTERAQRSADPSCSAADNELSVRCLAFCACCAFMAIYKLNRTSCAAKGPCHSGTAGWKLFQSQLRKPTSRGLVSLLNKGACNPLLTYLPCYKRALCYGIWIPAWKLNIRTLSLCWLHKLAFQEHQLF